MQQASIEVVNMERMKKNKRKGRGFMNLGLLLMAAALCLAGYNLWDDQRAGQAVQESLKRVVSEIPEGIESAEKQMEHIVSLGEMEIPDFVLNPEMEMPEKIINGQGYIGVVEIPKLELELPIISEWSDEKLKLSPCRYVGSAYTGDMILSGHSYVNHFRYIRKLESGDRVNFTDMDGNRFIYQVVSSEVIGERDIDGMLLGDWDLTLFTCTPGGQSRNTVRCQLVEEENAWMKQIGSY